MLACYHAGNDDDNRQGGDPADDIAGVSPSSGAAEKREPDPFARAQNVEGFAKLEEKLADLERNHYQVWGVEDDHGVLKVNVVLSLRPRIQPRSRGSP